MVLIGVSRGGSFVEFAVQAFFPTPAVAWQLLQGVTLYAVLACLTYLRARPPLPSFVVVPQAQEAVAKDQSPSRYFIRKGEDIHPIEISQIVSITGADDYAEVVTTSGRHLVKMTLTEFENTLEVDNFIRVHRSHIVNVDRIARAEPAGGGRMLLHMDNGEMISASRAGSRLLRDRVI
jgi:DNA-binding LytR/AlgR family response regulator